MRLRPWYATAALVVLLTGCGGGESGDEANTATDEAEGYISEATFSDPWPFTTTEGVVGCEGAGSVTFTSDGTTYAINGTARDQTDYPDFDPIWKDAEGGLKVNIGPVIDMGLEMCD